jgi:hypothetical protein
LSKFDILHGHNNFSFGFQSTHPSAAPSIAHGVTNKTRRPDLPRAPLCPRGKDFDFDFGFDFDPLRMHELNPRAALVP